MGLDMYAYVATKANQDQEWWDGAQIDKETKDYVNPNVTKPREIAYWRKHPNLHGWMEKLWRKKGNDGEFNGVELELTRDDIDQLEQDIVNGVVENLETTGFFFGNASDSYYRQQDLEFIKTARAELFCGLKVFYNSSW